MLLFGEGYELWSSSMLGSVCFVLGLFSNPEDGATCLSETSVDFQLTAQCYNPYDRTLPHCTPVTSFRYFLSNKFGILLGPCSSVGVRDQVWNPNRKTGNTIILYVLILKFWNRKKKDFELDITECSSYLILDRSTGKLAVSYCKIVLQIQSPDLC